MELELDEDELELGAAWVGCEELKTCLTSASDTVNDGLEVTSLPGAAATPGTRNRTAAW